MGLYDCIFRPQDRNNSFWNQVSGLVRKMPGGFQSRKEMSNKNLSRSAIKRNASESVLMRWMNREPIIQSEMSLKQKDKYCILTHIYGI